LQNSYVTKLGVGKHRRHCYSTSQLTVTVTTVQCVIRSRYLLDLAVASRVDMFSVQILCDAKWLQYMQLQEDHSFLLPLSP